MLESCWEENLTFSMVVQACLSGVVKQSGRGPPSRQIFDSISIRTESPKPRGFVAWSEKYLERKQSNKQLGHQMRATTLTFWSISKHTVVQKIPNEWRKKDSILQIIFFYKASFREWKVKSSFNKTTGIFVHSNIEKQHWAGLLVVEDHGIVLGLLAVVLALFSC